MKKRIIALGLAAVLVLMLTACGGGTGKGNDSASAGSTDSASKPIMEEPLVKEVADDGLCHIGILTYRNHGAAEETIKGFEDEFRSMMGSTEVVFERMDADGDSEKCARIATGYANSGYKLIFAVGTEAVQNAGAAVKDVPIIGACVTDYLLAEVVSSLEAPGGNITGVSSMGPINLQIDQITDVLPWPTKVGIVASGTEVGSKFQVSIAAQCLAEKNIEWESYNGNTEETLREVLEKAASECSCLYLPTDSFVASHMDIVKEVSLSYASMRHRYGKEEFNQVSRFITEIDGRYLDGDVPQRSAEPAARQPPARTAVVPYTVPVPASVAPDRTVTFVSTVLVAGIDPSTFKRPPFTSTRPDAV